MFNNSSYALYDSDKILSFIYNKLFKKFGVFRVITVLLIVPITLCFIAGYLENTLYNKENLVGVIKDYTLYALWIVVFLSIYLYYNYSNFTQCFFSEKISKIINKDKIDKNKLEELDLKLSEIIGAKKIFKYFKLTLILVFIFFHIQNIFNSFDPVKHYGYDIWHSANHPIGFTILKLFNFLYSTILLSLFFYKFVANLVGFSWLFKKLSDLNAFIIKPLAPDNAAGLKILSNLSLHFMYMVLPFFLVFFTMILRGTTFLPGQQISFFSLIVLLFITFFLPLGFVHSAMKRAKNRELEYLSYHFSILNEAVKTKMNKNEYGVELINDIISLEKLDFLYAKTEKMPVWPFNFENLGRVLLASLIPVIVFLIQLIVNADSILYNLDKLELFNKIFN